MAAVVTSRQQAKAFKQAVDQTLVVLERERDPLVRAQVAHDLTELIRSTSEQFGEQRTLAFVELRERLDYSLSDLAAEFNISRARAAQIACRDRYKENRK